MSTPIHIAVIDDDEAVLDSLRLYFARQNIETSCFESAKDFLAAIASGRRFDCIISDVRMPGMSGLDLVYRLRQNGLTAPVILITGHGDVDMAVAAIKVGAFDFIEKPFDEARLLASIRNAIEKKQQPEIDATELEKLRSRFNSLSARQRQVMELAVAGLSNKEIGSQLKISPKTVETHRMSLLRKLNLKTPGQFIRYAVQHEQSGIRPG